MEASDEFFDQGDEQAAERRDDRAQRLGQHDEAEHLGEREAEGPGRLGLAAGDGVDAGPHRLGHERPPCRRDSTMTAEGNGSYGPTPTFVKPKKNSTQQHGERRVAEQLDPRRRRPTRRGGTGLTRQAATIVPSTRAKANDQQGEPDRGPQCPGRRRRGCRGRPPVVLAPLGLRLVVVVVVRAVVVVVAPSHRRMPPVVVEPPAAVVVVAPVAAPVEV